MSITKRQYEQMAMVLRDIRRKTADNLEGVTARKVLDVVATEVSRLFAEDNPRFDRTRFLAAAKGEDAKTESGRALKYSKKGPGEMNEVYGGPAIGMEQHR